MHKQLDNQRHCNEDNATMTFKLHYAKLSNAGMEKNVSSHPPSALRNARITCTPQVINFNPSFSQWDSGMGMIFVIASTTISALPIFTNLLVERAAKCCM